MEHLPSLMQMIHSSFISTRIRVKLVSQLPLLQPIHEVGQSSFGLVHNGCRYFSCIYWTVWTFLWQSLLKNNSLFSLHLFMTTLTSNMKLMFIGFYKLSSVRFLFGMPRMSYRCVKMLMASALNAAAQYLGWPESLNQWCLALHSLFHSPRST